MLKINLNSLSEKIIDDYLVDTETLNEPISSDTIFNNDHPLHLEIGCGNGHFLLARSQKYTDINFIGLDRLKKRITKSIYKVSKQDIPNVRFLIGEGKYLLRNRFADESIQTCYLNFPDPWPKRKHHKHRLFNADFVDVLYDKLQLNGIFFAVSDHELYFFEILELLENDPRFINAFSTRYRNDLEEYEISLFEEKWRSLNIKIFYLKFSKKK